METTQEWKYKFKAYMGIQDSIYPDLLSRAERATTVLTDAELTAAAGTPEEAERWIQLANNLKYILISTMHNISCSSNGVPTTPGSNGS